MTQRSPTRRPTTSAVAVSCLIGLGLVVGCVAAGAGFPGPGAGRDLEVAGVTAEASASPGASVVSPSPDSLPSPSPDPLPSPSPDPSRSPSLRIAAPEVNPVLETPPPAPIWDPRPAPGPFEIDLYENGDFASQATKDLCLPAAALTMINIMSPGSEDSKARQLELLEIARSFSSDKLRGPGAEPEGWAAALNEEGFGPYAVRTYRSRGAAIEDAAMAIRLTGKPVGIVAWRGHHSWVMSGFRSDADPAWTTAYTVSHVVIEDPWFPRISSIWGASREPGSLVPVERLGEDILPWRQTAFYADKHDRFVLILPLRDVPTA